MVSPLTPDRAVHTRAFRDLPSTEGHTQLRNSALIEVLAIQFSAVLGPTIGLLLVCPPSLPKRTANSINGHLG